MTFNNSRGAYVPKWNMWSDSKQSLPTGLYKKIDKLIKNRQAKFIQAILGDQVRTKPDVNGENTILNGRTRYKQIVRMYSADRRKNPFFVGVGGGVFSLFLSRGGCCWRRTAV